MQLDIFADTPAATEPTPRKPVAENPPRAAADAPGWCLGVLEQGLASSKRQLSALVADQHRLANVLAAIWTVACAKRDAYERAYRGERLSAFGCAGTAVGDAGAVLSAVFLANDAIPMAEVSASGGTAPERQR